MLATQRRSTNRRLALTAKIAAATSDAAAADDAASDEVADAVRDALMRLPERDREAITLVAWDDLSPSQAAVVLGISRVALRARLARARRRVRKQLEQQLPEADRFAEAVRIPVEPIPAQARKEGHCD